MKQIIRKLKQKGKEKNYKKNPKNIKLNYIILNKIVITIMKEYNYQLAVFIKKNICRVRLMVFNANFNNISVISWRSVLLVEETGEKHRLVSSH